MKSEISESCAGGSMLETTSFLKMVLKFQKCPEIGVWENFPKMGDETLMQGENALQKDCWPNGDIIYKELLL